MLSKLIFNDSTITSDNIFDNVTYQQNINSEEDLVVGTTSSASVEFTTNLLDANSIGKEFDYYTKQYNDTDYRLIGHFIVTDAEKVDTSRYKITAYDNIYKFEKIVDDYIDSTTFPITLGNFFSGLCSFCSCTAYSTTFVNSTQSIKDNFTTQNISSRTVLGYIAQMAAGFIVATTDGKIAVKYYTTSSTSVDNNKYSECTQAEYTTDKITGVKVSISEDDVGCLVGTDNNLLSIEYNPLFFADTDAEIRGAVTNVYNTVKDIQYRPSTFSMYADYGIQCGDIITVDGSNVLVMSKTINDSGVEFASTGNKTRTITAVTNSSINALRGKYTKIKNEIGDVEVEVGTLTGEVSSLSIRVDGIETKVQNVSKTYRQDDAPTANAGDLWYCTKASDTTHYGKWWRYDGSSWLSCADPQVAINTSNITQNANNISAEVSSRVAGDNTLSGRISVNANKVAVVVTGSGTTSDPYKANAASIVTEINDSGSKVMIDADKIQMTGTTTFLTKAAADTYYDASGAANAVKTGLATSGYTTINGGNITTGTIAAQYIATDIGQVDSTLTLGTGVDNEAKIIFNDSEEVTRKANITSNQGFGLQLDAVDKPVTISSWDPLTTNKHAYVDVSAEDGVVDMIFNNTKLEVKDGVIRYTLDGSTWHNIGDGTCVFG